MQRLLLFILLACFPMKAYTQFTTPLKWANVFTARINYLTSLLTDMKTDDSGNVVICGMLSDTIDFDPGPGIYKLDTGLGKIFIAKLDSAGNFKWARSFGGAYTYVSLDIDADNNILCFGLSYGERDFDPGPSVVMMPHQSCFVTKWDTGGKLLWIRDFRRLDSERVSGSFAIAGFASDTAGNSYIMGNYCGNIDLDPGPSVWKLSCGDCRSLGGTYLVTLDKDGNFRWAKSLTCSGSPWGWGWGYYGGFNRMRLDSKKNIYYTGSFTGNVDFDPGPADSVLSTTRGAFEGFVCKLDSSGNLKWAKRLAGPGVGPGSIAIDRSDNVFISGTFESTMDMDPSYFPYILNVKPGETRNGFILKLDSAGAFKWGKGISEKSGILYNLYNDVEIDSRGYLYALATVTDSCFLYDRAGRQFVAKSKEQSVAMLKIDNTGNLRGGKVMIDTNSYNYYTQLQLDREDNIFIAGNFMDTIDADPDAGVKLLISGNARSMFIIKLGQIIPVSLSEQNNAESAAVFPNPTYGPVTLLINGFNEEAVVTVFTILGKKLVSITTKHSRAELDLGAQAPGIYLIEIRDKERKTYARVIKE